MEVCAIAGFGAVWFCKDKIVSGVAGSGAVLHGSVRLCDMIIKKDNAMIFFARWYFYNVARMMLFFQGHWGAAMISPMWFQMTHPKKDLDKK